MVGDLSVQETARPDSYVTLCKELSDLARDIDALKQRQVRLQKRSHQLVFPPCLSSF
jgi:hypothetical protein